MVILWLQMMMMFLKVLLEGTLIEFENFVRGRFGCEGVKHKTSMEIEWSSEAWDEDGSSGLRGIGCWIEYKVGEFIVNELDPATEVRFSLKQIDCTHCKGGLCVDSVSIIRSDLKD
uniref:Putative F-box protein PP2-A15 n=1 Tax=Davidia involucrata TaxID=16924 RepID=A0A5B7B8B1_DAVIN